MFAYMNKELRAASSKLQWNVWLEQILDQAQSREVGDFLDRTPAELDRSPDFLRLANALSALYPKGSDEKRLLDAMLLAVPR